MHNLIPHFIYEQYQAGRVNGRLQAVTLFLDISGFTPMTQSLMAHGKEGAEVLADSINRVFDPTINAVYERGGFITGFAGDAFTAVFPYAETGFFEKPPFLACAAALAIRQTFMNLGQQQTKLGDFTLAVKQGLSAGEVEWGIVGSDECKAYFFRGQAIDGCAQAEHQAKGGDIILDDRLQDLVGKTAVLQPLNNQFAQLVALKESVEIAPYPTQPVKIDPQTMVQFYPETVWKMSQQGEFRYAATLFVSFQSPDSINALNHFMKQVMTLVNRFDGFFSEIDFGDKGGLFIIYFGAPVTHERDVKRALDFIHALQEAETDIVWRAGISSGIVYAGYVGIPKRDKYTCMGTVMNLSARMMGHAAWGEILVSPDVALHPSFDFTPIGEVAYKGFRHPLSTYRLQGKTTAAEVFQQKLVGRELELNHLIDFAHPLFMGQRAGVALIYGEAGMGKSHLSYALSQELGSRVKWIMGQSDPVLRQAFNPFIYFLKGYFSQSTEATEAENKANFIENLQELLTDLTEIRDSQHLHDELARTRSFLGALLGLHWPDSLYEQLDAKGRYQNTIIAVTVLLQAECRRQPVVLELEDGHWLDDTSHELLTTLTRQTGELPLLILITSRYADDGSRPVYDLDSTAPTLSIDLTALTAVSIQTLAQEMLGTRIDSALQSILMEKTQANPFYTQQIITLVFPNWVRK